MSSRSSSPRRGGGESGNRTLFANDVDRNEVSGEDWCDNVVVTSNYTAWNFVPLFLFQQFSRFANFYFLCVCALQMVPSISITAGVPTTMVPLASVIIFDGVLTAIEDYKRHKDDEVNNARPALVMNDGRKFRKTHWREVRVGDILKVHSGETFPSDLLFLRAFTEDNATPEQCYVMTAQLDGETNLKLKQAISETADRFVDERACAEFRGVVKAEAPNGFFSKFSGTIRMEPNSEGHPLSADQILLRGCVLRNVDYVYAMVVYTGDQTKIRVKQTEKVFKKASVEGTINYNILLLVAMLVAICVSGTILFVVWSADHENDWYLRLDGRPGFLKIVEKVFTFFLLNNAFIPVSLYVTMKMARQCQKWFMEWDVRMYHEDKEQVKLTDGKEGHYPMRVRSMDLNDELGQISHVFSDKTGTFTLNYMEFRKMCVNAVSFGRGTTQIGLDRLKREGKDTSELEKIMNANERAEKPVPHVNFDDGSESHQGRSVEGDLSRRGTPEHEAMHFFLLHLVLNHSVVVEKVRNENNEVIASRLSASSPDEEAFVNAGTFFGYKFITRQNDRVKLNVRGRDLDVQVLHTLAYNQMRKRMSVICRVDGKIVLFMKGADNVLYERLKSSSSADQNKLRSKTMALLNEWGSDGLRTLVFAFKIIGADEYAKWDQRYRAAVGSMEEITKKKNKKPNKIDALVEEAEAGVTLQGATANEDKLQPKVPETIEKLADAGMSIWMLTGDKQETAINIGWSTRMLKKGMRKVLLTSSSCPDAAAFSGKLLNLAREISDMTEQERYHAQPMALVIDEKYLDVALDPQSPRRVRHHDNLLMVTQHCKAVICCRCRPDQKAAMVRLIKDGVPGTRTLAVGDGANDVDMIQTAHVGVGIAGAEGVQAANASDYAIGRFHFLQRLLLVHGRWNYRRMSKLVLYMFYKNIAFVLTQFWYSVYTGWSGQKYYIELATQTFNLIYTGAPIIVLALFDQDVSDRMSLRFPVLYKDGPAGRRLNNRLFWGWVFSAVIESLLTFLFCANAMWFASVDGVSPSVFELGVVTFNAITIVVSVRVAVETHWHHWIFQVLLFLSVISLVPFFYLFDLFDGNGMKGGVGRMYGSGSCIMVVILVSFATQLRIVFWKVYKRYFRAEGRHVVQEAQLRLQGSHSPDELSQYLRIQKNGEASATYSRKQSPRRPGSGSSRGASAGAGGGAGAGAGIAVARSLRKLDGASSVRAMEVATNPMYHMDGKVKSKRRRRVCCIL